MRSLRRLRAAVAMLALVTAACGDQVNAQRQAEVTDDGIQLSGRVGGAQLSVSFGDPDFLITDCDTQDGLDQDWCLVARSIDGARVELIFENPIAFVAGSKLDVSFDRCTDCDQITDSAIIDLVVDGERRRSTDGTVEVVEAGPRYSMTFTLRFADGGTITGQFNVRPLGAVVPAEDRFDSEPGAG